MTGRRKRTGVQIGHVRDGSGAAMVEQVPEFLRRGQRAQAAVDRILAAEPERKRLPRPKGQA